jgi:hypothetical protein
MSKGSTPRPFSVANEEYASRWDAIFGRDDKPSYEADDGALTNEQIEQIITGAEVNSGNGEYIECSLSELPKSPYSDILNK